MSDYGRLSQSLTIRFSIQQLQTLRRKADGAGRSPGDYVRRTLRESFQLDVELERLARIEADLRERTLSLENRSDRMIAMLAEERIRLDRMRAENDERTRVLNIREDRMLAL